MLNLDFRYKQFSSTISTKSFNNNKSLLKNGPCVPKIIRNIILTKDLGEKFHYAENVIYFFDTGTLKIESVHPAQLPDFGAARMENCSLRAGLVYYSYYRHFYCYFAHYASTPVDESTEKPIRTHCSTFRQKYFNKLIELGTRAWK
jgi:hypothetical protein